MASAKRNIWSQPDERGSILWTLKHHLGSVTSILLIKAIGFLCSLRNRVLCDDKTILNSADELIFGGGGDAPLSSAPAWSIFFRLTFGWRIKFGSDGQIWRRRVYLVGLSSRWCQPPLRWRFRACNFKQWRTLKIWLTRQILYILGFTPASVVTVLSDALDHFAISNNLVISDFSKLILRRGLLVVNSLLYFLIL